MNLASLSLASAGLAGLAAAFFALDWLRAVASALPGTVPAGNAAVPGMLVAFAVGAAATRAGGRPLVVALRRLALVAVAMLASRWMLELVVAPRDTVVPSGASRLWLSILPAVPAAALLGAALAALARVRTAQGARAAAALGDLLAAAATGALVPVLLQRELLLAGTAQATAAALCALGAALVCGALSLWEREAVSDTAPHARADESPVLGVLLALLAGALATGLLRPVLSLALQSSGNDLRTRTTVAACLLIGLALGAWLAARRGARMGRPMAVSSALVVGALAPLLHGLPWECAAVLPGVGLGASLPVAASRLSRPGGARVVLACAGLGAALGWLAQEALRTAGWGAGERLQFAALAAAVAALLAAFVALVVLATGSRLQRLLALAPGLVIGGLLWAQPAPEPPWRPAPDETALIRQLNDPDGTLALVATVDGVVRRTLDGWPLPSGTAGAVDGRRMARLSAVMRPGAESALLVGAGDGQLLLGLDELLSGTLQCIEPLAVLVEQAAASAPAGTERRLPEHADPRAFIAGSVASFDLVVVAPQPPGRARQGEQLAVEHVLSLRRALRPGGVVVQWFPLQQMPWPAFASAARAFLEVFPEARVFVAALRADEPLVALVGGLDDGLPGVEQLDAVLAAAPSSVGVSGAADVFDLYVCDGWTLGGRVRDAEPTTLARPLSELLSERRERQALPLSILNLRLLADLATPLDTVSLAARPVLEKDDRALGAELVARSSALRWLLVAQAARLERLVARPGSQSGDERGALEDEQGAALIGAWAAAPGHADARAALLAFASELAGAGRWTMADSLLASANAVRPDGRLLGLRAGVLVDLQALDEAVAVGRQAVQAAPDDAGALVSLARALLFTAQDDEARAVLLRARAALEPSPLPPPYAVSLALLEGQDGATEQAGALLERLPSSESWAGVLRRLAAR